MTTSSTGESASTAASQALSSDASELRRRLWLAALLLAVLFALGTGWYWLVEGFHPVDALYQAVTTLTTVGFQEVEPFGHRARLFTTAYILVGVGVVFYFVVTAVETLVVGGLAELFGARREAGRTRRMHDHYVVCGFGRVGAEIARELAEHHVPFVIVDSLPARQALARERGYAAIAGDATEEPVLLEAGVERAKVLIAASDSDVGNVFVTITARALNPTLFIIARAGTEPAEQRLRAAGANRVISPYQIAGRRMALAAVQPLLLDFVPVAGGKARDSVNLMAEVLIADEAAGLAGRTLGDAFAGLRSLRVLGIEHADGQFVVGPPPATVLRHDDRVMLYGEQQEIEELATDRAGRTQSGATASTASSSV